MKKINSVKLKYFWSGVFIVVITSILSIIFNNNIGIINLSDNNGAVNLFYYSTMNFNPYMQTFAPLISILASFSIFNRSYNEHRVKPLIKKAINAAFLGGIVFIVAYTFLFIAAYIYNPSFSNILLDVHGLFSNVYYVSPILYVLMYALHSFIFGSIFALLGMGLFLQTKSMNYTFILSLIIYRAQNYLPYNNDQPILAHFLGIFPIFPYEFASSGRSLTENLLDLLLIFLLSCTLIFIHYRKWKVGISGGNPRV